jgi:hypothetical protein
MSRQGGCAVNPAAPDPALELPHPAALRPGADLSRLMTDGVGGGRPPATIAEAPDSDDESRDTASWHVATR